MNVFAYVYHTSTHEATGFSPYELASGRTTRTLIEIDLDIPLKIHGVIPNIHCQFAAPSGPSSSQPSRKSLIVDLNRNGTTISILRSGYLFQQTVQCGHVAKIPGNSVEGGLDHSGLSLEKGSIMLYALLKVDIELCIAII